MAFEPADFPSDRPGITPRAPIGLRPKKEAQRERAREILEAVFRYKAAKKEIPDGWLYELGEIINDL